MSKKYIRFQAILTVILVSFTLSFCSSGSDEDFPGAAPPQQSEPDRSAAPFAEGEEPAPLSLGLSDSPVDLTESTSESTLVTSSTTAEQTSTENGGLTRTWTFNKPGTAAIAIYFSQFKTEKNHEFVKIYNGEGIEQASYHGDLGAFWTPKFDGDSITVTYTTDDSSLNGVFAVSEVRYVAGEKPADLNWQKVDNHIKESAHPYSANSSEVQTITHVGADSISVYFDYIDTEANNDYVLLLDSEDNVIDSYTGSRSPLWSVPVAGDTVKIKLVSDWNTEKQGYKISKYKYGEDTTQSADFTQSAASYHTPHNYPDNYSNSWTVSAVGAQSIQLHFKDFHTEKNWDFVTLRTVDGSELARYSGDLGDFWTDVFNTDTVKVYLESDSSINEYGFSIDKIAHKNGTPPDPPEYDRYIFDEIVAIGDSLCHSFQSGSVEETRQADSYCNVFARRAGDPLVNPLFKYPGWIVQGEDVFKGDCGVFCMAKALVASRVNDDNSNVTNFAVTGADSISVYYGTGECADKRYRERKWSWTKFRYVDACQKDADNFFKLTLLNNESQVEWALKKNPSFVSAWFSNNDTLSTALHTDPTAMTDYSVFKAQVDKIFKDFSSIQARGVTASTPNVTAIRYLVQNNNSDPRLNGLKAFYNPTVSKPEEVLDASEVKYITTELDKKNLYLRRKAAAMNWAFVDAYAVFNEIKNNGYDVRDKNGNLTGDKVYATWPENGRYGLFSLDGVHPNKTGHCIAGNAFIDAVNAHYGTEIQHCNEASTLASDSLNQSPVSIPDFLANNIFGKVISALIDVFI